MSSLGPERDSGLRIDVTISVGYERRRSSTTDRWEQRLSAGGLLLIGSVVVVAILVVVVPRILAWLAGL